MTSNTTNQQQLFQQPPQGDIIKDVHDVPAPQTSDPEGTEKKLINLDTVDFSTLSEDAAQLPENYCLPCGIPHAVFCCVGDPKTGKSQIMLQLAIMLATNRPDIIPCLATGRKRRVLYYGVENERNALAKRLKHICDYYNILYGADAAPDLQNCIFKGLSGHRAEFQILENGHACEIGLSTIERDIKQHHAELVIIDPIAPCISGLLNDAKDAIMVHTLLGDLASRCDCSFLIVMHARKKNDESGRESDKADDVSGSGAWTAYSKVVFNVFRSLDDTDNHTYLKFTAANEEKKSEAVFKFRFDENADVLIQESANLLHKKPAPANKKSKGKLAATDEETAKLIDMFRGGTTLRKKQ